MPKILQSGSERSANLPDVKFVVGHNTLWVLLTVAFLCFCSSPLKAQELNGGSATLTPAGESLERDADTLLLAAHSDSHSASIFKNEANKILGFFGLDWRSAFVFVNSIFEAAKSAGLLSGVQDYLSNTFGLDWYTAPDVVETVTGNTEATRLFAQLRTYLFDAFNINWTTVQPSFAAIANAAGLYTREQYDLNRKNGRRDVTGNPRNYGLIPKWQHERHGLQRFTDGQSSVTENPSAYGLHTSQELNASRENGRTDVLSNPQTFGLYTGSEYETLGITRFAEGQASVTENPTTFNLFTKAQRDSFGQTRFVQGTKAVVEDPADFGLFPKTGFPTLEFSMPKRSAFALRLGGDWTRFAQSGAPKSWDFNSKAGVLEGVVPSSGQATIRVIPYVGAQAGPPIIILVKPAR